MDFKKLILVTMMGMIIPCFAQPGKSLIVTDDESGLTWTRDSNYVVTSGLANQATMSRRAALDILAALNTGTVNNFGFTDWRLPTDGELRLIYEKSPNRAVEDRKATNGTKPGHVMVWPVRGSALEEGINSVVALAINSILLEQSVDVVSGSIVVNEVGNGSTLDPPYELSVKNAVRTPAGYTLEADSIRIRPGARIDGDVYFNELTNNGNISGTLNTPLSLPVFGLLPPFQSAPSDPGGPPPFDVIVPQNGSRVLTDGNYGNIEIGRNGTLVMTGGIYNVNNISMETHSRLEFSTPTEIRVTEKLESGQNSYIGPESGSSVQPSEVVIYVRGVDGNSGVLGETPEAVLIGQNNDLSTNIYAPNGTINIRQNTDAAGAFIGGNVQAGNNVELTLDSFFVNSPPIAGNDSMTVSTGQTVTSLDDGSNSLLDNDSDPDGHNLTVSPVPVSGPDHGTLILNPDGTFSYTHDGGSATQDSFVYEVCDDGSPIECTTGTVMITILSQSITVSVTLSGPGTGNVTSTPTGISCGPVCSAFFSINDTIFLEASADPGSVFAGWSGDRDCFDGIIRPAGDINCTATFELAPPPPPDIQVTITKQGSGSGTVVSTPSGINCGPICSALFPERTRIDLGAIPNPGSFFAGWSGDADCLDGFLNGFTDTNCIAIFEEEVTPPETFDLRIIVLGTGGGTVTSNPSGIFCVDDCTASFEAGTTVSLSARPDPGSTLIEWGGDCSGTTFFNSALMDGDKTCTITFDNQ